MAALVRSSRAEQVGFDVARPCAGLQSSSMSERRYSDDEVTAIFRAAAENGELPAGSSSGDDGLTLAELQAIGREVGISPDDVASAAIAIDVKRAATERTFFGLPIGVARTVELNRRMTDDEWDLLVVRLREVFHARGRTSSEGSLRQWTNGNLHVLLEPTEKGQRLRFGTFNAAAHASIRTGLLSVGAVSVMAVATAMSGTIAHAAPMLTLVGSIGVGLVANGVLRLPRWAKLRGHQMETLAAAVAASSPTSLPPTRNRE
jgi:hypothetical protein